MKIDHQRRKNPFQLLGVLRSSNRREFRWVENPASRPTDFAARRGVTFRVKQTTFGSLYRRRIAELSGSALSRTAARAARPAGNPRRRWFNLTARHTASMRPGERCQLENILWQRWSSPGAVRSEVRRIVRKL